jgi:hypothetical protein
MGHPYDPLSRFWILPPLAGMFILPTKFFDLSLLCSTSVS